MTGLGDARSGDEIWVADGVYHPDNDVFTPDDPLSTYQLKPYLGIYGGFNGTETDRNQRDPVSNTTVLSGDIDGNDTVDAFGITRTFNDLAGTNAYHLITATGNKRRHCP